MGAFEESSAAQLQAEQLQMHAVNLPLAVGGSALGAAVLAVVLAPPVGAQVACGWMAWMAAVFAGLAWFGVRHRRAKPALEASGRWLRRFRVSVAMHGMAWGAAGVVLYPGHDVVYQSFLGIVLVGVAASGASMVALDFAAALLFVIPVLTPLGVRVLADADTLHLAIGGLLWVYMSFLVMNSKLAYRRQLEVTQLRTVDAARVRALRRSEELLERTGELARVGGWELDRATRTLRLTPQAYRVLGIEPVSVLTPELMLNCFTPAARTLLEQAVRTALDEALPFSLELPCVPDAVRPRWVSCIGFPDIENDRVVRLRGALQDVGDRKLAEQRLQENTEQTRAIVDNVLEGIVTFDTDDSIVTFNRAAERIFGYSFDQVARKPIGLLVPQLSGAWREHDLAGHRGADAADRAVELARELEGVRSDGARFAMEMALSKFVRAGHVSYVGLIRDISQRKADEAALLAAKDAAEQASQAKSAFLANMSHEIRTPMNGMLGMAELLSKMPLLPEQKKYVDTMRRSGRSLLSLLNDILDLSRIEAGKLELEHRQFNLRRAVQACTDLMGPTASQKGLSLAADFADALPVQVVGDPLRLQQVLNNIVGNAIKFTHAGEVGISVTTEPSLGPAGIRICVEDTGPGIDAATIDSLFGAFVQGDNSTARKHGGSGLGLAIARRIVEAMGGVLTAEPAEGGGSRFCFTARLGPCAAGEARVEEAEASLFGPLDQLGETLHAPRRILIAEDNPVNQMYMQAVLQKLGHTVDVAEDGVQAVEMGLGGDRYDVILMDCHMPLLDGFEATRRIRAAEARRGGPRQRIVAVTASAMAEDRQRCLACGMDDALSKPFSIDEMREVLDRPASGASA